MSKTFGLQLRNARDVPCILRFNLHACQSIFLQYFNALFESVRLWATQHDHTYATTYPLSAASWSRLRKSKTHFWQKFTVTRNFNLIRDDVVVLCFCFYIVFWSNNVNRHYSQERYFKFVCTPHQNTHLLRNILQSSLLISRNMSTNLGQQMQLLYLNFMLHAILKGTSRCATLGRQNTGK